MLCCYARASTRPVMAVRQQQQHSASGNSSLVKPARSLGFSAPFHTSDTGILSLSMFTSGL